MKRAEKETTKATGYLLEPIVSVLNKLPPTSLANRATKRKHSSLDIPVVRLEEVADILNEEQMEENEEDILRKKKVVFDNLQLKHPITYKSYNLCKLAADEKRATKFSIAELRNICDSLDVNTDNFN